MSLPIETTSLLLRHFRIEDTQRIFALSQEDSLRTWIPNQVYRDEAHARSVLEYLIAQCEHPGHPAHGPYVLAIDRKSDGELIGHVGFSPVGDDVEIGFAVAQQCQKQGLATEAIVAASQWALDRFKLGRIVGIAAAANVASRRALARAGYRYEGDRVMMSQGIEQTMSVYAFGNA